MADPMLCPFGLEATKSLKNTAKKHNPMRATVSTIVKRVTKKESKILPKFPVNGCFQHRHKVKAKAPATTRA